MTETHRFTGCVEGGKVHLDDRQRWDSVAVGLEGKRVELTLAKYRASRSDRANRYLWAIYNYIAEWSGHEPEEIHHLMKHLHLPGKPLTLPSGEVVEIRTTRTLNSEDFGHYVDRVKLWAAEQGIELPEPEQVA